MTDYVQLPISHVCTELDYQAMDMHDTTEHVCNHVCLAVDKRLVASIGCIFLCDYFLQQNSVLKYFLLKCFPLGYLLAIFQYLKFF